MMLDLLLAIAITLTDVDGAARHEAEQAADAAVTAYAAALLDGSPDLPALERLVSQTQISLHAIYERDRMRQIDLAIDLERLRVASAASRAGATSEDLAAIAELEEELRSLQALREDYLARWTAIELKHQDLLTSARAGRL